MSNKKIVYIICILIIVVMSYSIVYLFNLGLEQAKQATKDGMIWKQGYVPVNTTTEQKPYGIVLRLNCTK